MNVEHKPATASHGRAVDAGHARGKVSGPLAGAGAAPEEGGFLSLLVALGGDEGADVGADAVADASVDAALLSGTGAAPTDPQTLLAAPRDGSDASVSPSAGTPAEGDAVLPLWASPDQMLLGRQLTEGKPAIEVQPATGESHVAALGASPAGSMPPRATAVSPGNGLKLGQNVALRDMAGPLGRAVSEQMQTSAPGRLAHNGDAHARAGEGFRLDMASAASTATEQALTATTALSAAAERRGDKTADPVARLLGDAAWSQPTLVPEGSADVAAASAGAAVGGPDRQVAEQVSYWIANDVQNAELKLDQFGNSPVDVSISLQGNEARVEFRSDLQEMRQVLQGAVTHLKDLLHSQGLVLAGVSVGTSGADTPGQREQAPGRQNARQATVAVPSLTPLDGARAVGRPSGRALDVFV